MKQFFIFTFLLLCSFPLFSQIKFKPAELSEVRKNKFQVELGLRSFSGIWNGTSGASLLFKKQMTGGKLIEVNSMKLLRATLTLNSQITFTDDPTLSPEDTTAIRFHPADQINFTVGLGIEKQKKGKFLIHYFGVELFTRFHKRDDDIFNGNIGGITVNQTGTTDRYFQTLQVGLNPFFGFKYYFTDQFSIGIETNLQLFWFNTKFTEVGFETTSVNGFPVTKFVENDPVTANGIGTYFNGVRFVTFGYSF